MEEQTDVAPPGVSETEAAVEGAELKWSQVRSLRGLVPSSWSRRCPAEPRRSPCVVQTLCTWSRSASGRTGSRC